METRARRFPIASWLGLMAGLFLAIPAASRLPIVQYSTFLGGTGLDEGFAVGQSACSFTAWASDLDADPHGYLYLTGLAEARDDKGAACTATVKVCVPHDHSRGGSCGDGGLFDSTAN